MDEVLEERIEERLEWEEMLLELEEGPGLDPAPDDAVEM